MNTDNFWLAWDYFKEKFLSPAKVRTTVPAFLGAMLTFALNRWGIDLNGYAVDVAAEFGLTLSREAMFAFVTSGVTYVVYSLITLIEQNRPNAGLLLGRRGTPTYGVQVITENPIVAIDEDIVDNFNDV